MELVIRSIPQELVGVKEKTYEELGFIEVHRGNKIDLELEIDDNQFTKEVLKKYVTSLFLTLAEM